MRFGDVLGLLQQALFAVAQKLAAGAVGFLQVGPCGLVEAGVHCKILPVAVLGDDQRLGRQLVLRADPVLACLQVNVIRLRHPAGRKRLVARVFLVHGAVQLVDQRLRHVGLVERALPCDDAGMVAVAPDHVGAGLHRLAGKRGIGIDVLPTGNGVQQHQAQFVRRSHEGRRVRVVRQAHVVVAGLLDQERIAVVGLRRDRIADVWILLVPVHAAQEHAFAVDQ